MDTNIHSFRKSLLEKDTFFWKTTEGKNINPKDMETKYIYLTLRNIWNHAVPVNRRLSPDYNCSFGKFYSPGYMAAALKFLFLELTLRRDLKPRWRHEIKRIERHIADMLEEGTFTWESKAGNDSIIKQLEFIRALRID